jgi:hypothetical protein
VAVPPEVVTTTSAAPAEPGGVTMETSTLLMTVNGAVFPPTVTDSVVAKLVPVTVTPVPPEVGPSVGLTLETVGAST